MVIWYDMICQDKNENFFQFPPYILATAVGTNKLRTQTAKHTENLEHKPARSKVLSPPLSTSIVDILDVTFSKSNCCFCH